MLHQAADLSLAKLLADEQQHRSLFTPDLPLKTQHRQLTERLAREDLILI